ncbi:hypothetical protein [Streptomyces aureus]|uniref:Uncharacterized protein n=1 Tax=Streptomyces aureus TaxID=193461 RepID=A0ABV4SFA5_9ACTN
MTRRLIQEAVEHADAEDRPDFYGPLAPAFATLGDLDRLVQHLATLHRDGRKRALLTPAASASRARLSPSSTTSRTAAYCLALAAAVTSPPPVGLVKRSLAHGFAEDVIAPLTARPEPGVPARDRSSTRGDPAARRTGGTVHDQATGKL